jgi:hypothetical protein
MSYYPTDAAFGQSGRVGWDGAWVGGWEKGTGAARITGEQPQRSGEGSGVEVSPHSGAAPRGAAKIISFYANINSHHPVR